MSALERFNALELHDADLSSITFMQDEDGDWSVVMRVKQGEGGLSLRFSGCRLLRTNIRGGMARADTIDDAIATVESPIIVEVARWPAALKVGCAHYHFSTNSGAVIDIVADEVDVTRER